MDTTTPKCMKIDLSKPFRVGVGRHTDHVYILQGDLSVEETNGTVTPWSPAFAVGDRVRIKPHAVRGLMGMIGEVECIYIAVDGGHLHVYSVRTMGTLLFADEADLEPAELPSDGTIYNLKHCVTPTCSHQEVRFDTLGLRCVCCGYVFPTVAPVTITSSST